MPRYAMADGTGRLARQTHVSHQIAARFLAHLILAARLMAGLAVCVRDQVWLGASGHELQFQALLEGERGAPPQGVPTQVNMCVTSHMQQHKAVVQNL